jgi:hypothetical protein
MDAFDARVSGAAQRADAEHQVTRGQRRVAAERDAPERARFVVLCARHLRVKPQVPA